MSPSAMEMERHGTYSRYTAGKCRCDECRIAAREYARNRRAKSAAARQYDRQQAKDYSEATRRLRDRHRDEFEAILAEVRGEQ